MSNVEFLVDPKKISQKEINIELCYEPYSTHKAKDIRSKIRHHLLENSPETLVVRLDEAWLSKFVDFKGMGGVRVSPVTPKSELAMRLRSELPSWCTDEFIIEYALLEKDIQGLVFDGEKADLQIISLICPDLLNTDESHQFLYAIKSINHRISPFLESDLFQEKIKGLLGRFYNGNVQAIIFNLLKSDNCSQQVLSLFQQVFFEKLRVITAKFDVQLHLPAREFESNFLGNFELNQIWWNDIKTEPYLSRATSKIIEKIKHEEFNEDIFPEAIFMLSDKQLEIICAAIKENPKLASVPLLNVIRSFDKIETAELEKVIEFYTEAPPPHIFDENWKAKEVIEWSEDYLLHAWTMFRRGSEPSGSVGEKFENWVMSQPTRVQNPPYGWRTVSHEVRKLLEEKKRVVLIVVDALGSIVSPELIRHLSNNDTTKLHIDSKQLFAPLPTLTEIGKIAVSTGKDSFKLSNSQDIALWEAYRDVLKDRQELQVLKSWQGENLFIGTQTKLLVYYQNQLDDQLHECLNFSDFADQLALVCKNVSYFINTLFNKNQSNYEDLEVIITADHGLTMISSSLESSKYKSLGKLSDRCIKVEKNALKSSEFWEIFPEGSNESSRFFVCQGRNKLTQGPRPFVHGGLTPEEVFIPFIRIRASETSAELHDFKIIISEAPITLTTSGWLVTFKVQVEDKALDYFSLEALTPFHSNTYKSTSLFMERSSIELLLNITSEIPQSGAVKLQLNARFHPIGNSGGVEEKVFEFDVNLPEHNLVQDQGALDFDNMFD